MTETKLDDIDVIECNDFTFKYKNRKKISSRRSGGIALGYRNYLENFITPLDTDCPYVLWFTIKKEIFNLSQNVIFGIIYIPPENTRYTSDDAISEIELEFLKFNENTDYVCLVGDFNSRTAKLLDVYEVEESNEFIYTNEFYDVYILDDLDIPRLRNNPDDIVNTYGRKLISFCKNNNMFVLNGRVGKDKSGKPTSKNNSVVDYAISSAHLLRKVEHFEILEFSKLFSDIHSPVSLRISCVKPENNYAVPQENVERIGKWKFEKGVDFNGNLDKNRIEHLLFNLLSYTDETTNMQKSNIDDIVTELSDILLTSAKSTFGFKNTRNCTNKSTKQWYNADCKKAKQNFRKAKRLYKHYGSHLFKQRLKASELFYKNTMDANIIKFNNNLREQIKTMRTKNP